jgi:hypothetical protein
VGLEEASLPVLPNHELATTASAARTATKAEDSEKRMMCGERPDERGNQRSGGYMIEYEGKVEEIESEEEGEEED